MGYGNETRSQHTAEVMERQAAELRAYKNGVSKGVKITAARFFASHFVATIATAIVCGWMLGNGADGEQVLMIAIGAGWLSMLYSFIFHGRYQP